MNNIHIYCPTRSESAFALVQALEAKRLRKFDGESFWSKGKRINVAEGDTIICWGKHLPPLDNYKILNAASRKLTEYGKLGSLNMAGMSTRRVVDAYEVYNPRDFTNAGYIPIPNEKDGSIKFWMENPPLIYRIRVHSFAGRSIRSAKVLENDRLDYDFKSTAHQRQLAAGAVKALGLVFAEVEIAFTQDERFLVWEIDTAPKLEGLTLNSYCRAIRKWIEAANKPAPAPIQDGLLGTFGELD